MESNYCKNRVQRYIMSLVDGIKFSFSFNESEYKKWIAVTNKTIRTWVSIYEDTGELKKEEDEGNGKWRTDRNKKYRWYTIVHTSKVQTYKIEIREKHYEYLMSEKQVTTFRGEVLGSITSNFHGGENWKDLNYCQLKLELENIEKVFQLDLRKVKIDNMEPSITFEIPFNVFGFLDKNLISYSNKPFNRYGKNRKGKALGRFIELTDHTTVKAYDKSEEYSLPNNLMQFELHFKKMSVLNRIGIFHLSDLRDWEKVNSMVNILISYFERILLFDPSIHRNDTRLTPIQKDMVVRGRGFVYWEDLKSDSANGTYYNRVREFKSLSTKYGEDYHNSIKRAFVRKWNELMEVDESCKDLPSVKKRELERFTSTVSKKKLQLNNKDCYLTNTIMNQEKVQETPKELVNAVIGKNKKQIVKDKRERDAKQFKSFLQALEFTIQKINKQAA